MVSTQMEVFDRLCCAAGATDQIELWDNGCVGDARKSLIVVRAQDAHWHARGNRNPVLAIGTNAGPVPVDLSPEGYEIAYETLGLDAHDIRVLTELGFPPASSWDW